MLMFLEIRQKSFLLGQYNIGNISILAKKFYVGQKCSMLGKNFYFGQKNYILAKNLYFWLKFVFLANICIFD